MQLDRKVHVILFNGPHNSGKDTAAKYAKFFCPEHHFRPELMKFADPLKEAAHMLYGIPFSTAYYEEKEGNDWKNKPQQEFFGETPRQVYIALSEEFAKQRPIAGANEFFGKIAARRVQLRKQSNVFIFSDCGFADEVRPVVERVGISQTAVVQIHRRGCDYSSDSRSYIGDELKKSYPNLRVFDVPNNQGLDLFRIVIRDTVRRILGIPAEE